MTPTPHPRERLRLDAGWSFHLGDIEPTAPEDHTWTYLSAKACAARGAASPEFDHTPDYDPDAWRGVDLPHDWQVEQPFDESENLDHGYRRRGVAWYRRKFRLDADDRGKHLAIDFDGVGTHCTFWVNGQLLHRNWCGYTGFRVDFTDVALFGDLLNTVVVRVDADAFEGWWYEGAGIYRHVWLVKTQPLHVAHWGTFVKPARSDDGMWKTHIETAVTNTSREARGFVLTSTLRGPDGSEVGRTHTPMAADVRETVEVAQCITVAEPALWSLEERNLYTLVSEVVVEGNVVDRYETTYGYRTIRFDADEGFFLNDRPVKLLGTCNHQDHAGVGVAVPHALQAFRIRRLKDMGGNAYRCAHNPPAPELLDECDRQGMLVMDENRNFSSATEEMAQLETMLRRDRNHPSVILWSIFNEETVQGTERGRKIAESIIDRVHELDDSRPVTAAMSGGYHEKEGVGEVIDVMGINYGLQAFEPYHAAHPGVPITASENNCAFSTRGEYATSGETKFFDSYDEQHASWGRTARETWRHVSTRPWIAGYFVWTGFDYRGEPSPHAWPCINSHWGILDTCGFAKDSFFLHRAFWTAEPMVHLLPHWNWEGREGETVRVMVHTNCDEVELTLNGESLGRKPIDTCEQASWGVPYQPGTLEAVGYRKGAAAAEAAVETTGKPVALRLEPDRPGLAADGEDAMPVTLYAVDEQGRRVPTANQLVQFAVEGPGELIGVGNGDPTCHEPDKSSQRSLFNGLCQAILRAGTETGTLRLTASAGGLQSATADIQLLAAEPRPSVPVPEDYILVTRWRVSPVTAERPDARAKIADHDVNTWEQVEVGTGAQTAFREAGGYAMYRTWQPVPRRSDVTAWTLVFEAVAGEAEVIVNGTARGAKETGETGPLRVTLGPDADQFELTVLVRAQAGGGITGPVKLVAE